MCSKAKEECHSGIGTGQVQVRVIPMVGIDEMMNDGRSVKRKG